MSDPYKDQDNSQKNDKKSSQSAFKRAMKHAGKNLLCAQMMYKTATVIEKVALQIGIHACFFLPLNNTVGIMLLYDDFKTYRKNKKEPAEMPSWICTDHFNGIALEPLECRHITFMKPQDFLASNDDYNKDKNQLEPSAN